MNIGEELIKIIEPQTVFTIKIFNKSIPITDTVISMWIAMAMIIIFALILTKGLKKNFKKIPQGKQNVAEIIVEYINNFCKNNIGEHGLYFAPYIGTLLFFLILSNGISIFNFIPTGEQLYKLTHIEFFKKIPEYSLRPPTRDINVTACLAVLSMVATLYAGIRFKKVSGWLKGLAKPVPIMVPFHIMDYFIRPISLCFRLYGNILGAVIIMELLYMAVPLFVPAAVSIYFDLFDGILQAYVFAFLTSTYIAEAVE